MEDNLNQWSFSTDMLGNSRIKNTSIQDENGITPRMRRKENQNMFM